MGGVKCSQAAPVAIDRDDFHLGTGHVAQGQRERPSPSAKVGPDAAACDPSLDEPDMIVMVHGWIPSGR